MAHSMNVLRPAEGSSGDLTGIDAAALAQARIELAACFRMAARLGLSEGVCNHFSAVVPGRDDLFLVNPYGLAFAEVTASCLLVCDHGGQVLLGEGEPEATAYYIHAQLHRHRPRARVAFHTHMPHATALAMVEGEPLVWASQTALKFHGRTILDPHYGGLALDEREGERIARAMGDADVVFLRNHGVIVTAPTIAEAWDDLYYLERACQVQLLAMASGRPLVPVEPAVAIDTRQRMAESDAESARAHLDSVIRQLQRLEPGFSV